MRHTLAFAVVAVLAGCGNDSPAVVPDTGAVVAADGGVDASSCQPNCDRKICGDDGCGGSCGSCDPGQGCQSGRCAALPADAAISGPDAASPGADAASPDAAGSGPDAGSPDAASPDAASPDAASAGPDAEVVLHEAEPNNGTTATEYNPITPPVAIDGVLGAPATNADIDYLGANLVAGDFWTWELKPTGLAKLAPHLAVFPSKGDVPNLVAIGAAGVTVEQEQFVLASELWYVGVADHSNPRDGTACSKTACVGGPDYGWLLHGRATARTPTPAVFPSTVDATLRHRRAINLYAFHATATFRFDIDLKARRKAVPSDLDSQLSLFDNTNKKWVITNDDAGATKDSHIGADALPANADYVLVVENLSPDATDLSYQLVFTPR